MKDIPTCWNQPPCDCDLCFWFMAAAYGLTFDESAPKEPQSKLEDYRVVCDRVLSPPEFIRGYQIPTHIEDFEGATFEYGHCPL